MPGLWETIFGSGDKTKQYSTLDPNQQQFMSQLFGMLGGQGSVGQNFGGANDFLSRLLSGDDSAYANFEAPYIQNFNEQILPGIAERFAGANPMGGALSSSGFGQALGGAGSQLQAQLAALRGQLQQGAAQQAMGQFNNMAGLGLGTRSFENVFQQGNGGLLGGALSGLGSGLGMGLGMGFGGGLPGLFGNFFGGGGGNSFGGMASRASNMAGRR